MKPFAPSVVCRGRETTMDLHEALQHNQARFHCDLCGQPLSEGGSTSLSYDYQGRAASFQACPTCLTARTLLPDLFGKWDEPPAARR